MKFASISLVKCTHQTSDSLHNSTFLDRQAILGAFAFTPCYRQNSRPGYNDQLSGSVAVRRVTCVLAS
ncbi:hypothetical protein OSTOST_07568 [Ostertagia ostertagi]